MVPLVAAFGARCVMAVVYVAHVVHNGNAVVDTATIRRIAAHVRRKVEGLNWKVNCLRALYPVPTIGLIDEPLEVNDLKLVLCESYVQSN